MRNKLLVIFSAIASLCIILALPVHTAYACSCGPTGPRQALHEADMAFVGRVVDIQHVERLDEKGATHIEDRNIFHVTEAWKGISAPQVTVVVSLGYIDSQGRRRETSCDRPNMFVVGEEYVVYAIRYEADFYVGLACGRTAHVKDAKVDIQVNGSGNQTGQLVGMPNAGEARHLAMVTFIIAASSLAVGMVFRRVSSN